MDTVFNGTEDHAGACLLMRDGAGNYEVYQISADSTITIQPLRTAADPEQAYSGSSVDAAIAEMNTIAGSL